MERSRGEVPIQAIWVLGFLLIAALLSTPASVRAAGAPPFLETFGAAEQPSFISPVGLAFDQSNNDLLVIDVEAKTISRYNSDGTSSNFSALGTNVIDGAGGADKTPEEGLAFGNANPRELQITVDNSGGATDGNIYVTQRIDEEPIDIFLIDIFAEDGTFLGQLTEFNTGPIAEGAAVEFEKTCGVAVDPAGTVYVSDLFAEEIHKYVPSGSFPVNGDNTANFARPIAGTLAAGAGPTDGFIFSNEFGGDLGKLNSTTGVEQYAVDTGENLTVTVDPASGRVFSAIVGKKVREYDASEPTEAILRSELTAASEVTGIAVDEDTGNLYVSREGNPQIEVFGPAPVVPEAVTESASPVGTTSATLRGAVNPNGESLTECFFEFVTEEQFGDSGYEEALSALCVDPNAAEVGNGSSPVAVHADISGLNPGTIYHFRLAAANANNPPGEPSLGDDEEFQTGGPSVQAGSATQITATGARVSGEINPNGSPTTFVIEYVTDAQFGLTGYDEAIVVPATPRSAGSGAEFVEFFQQLSGLVPNTGYHFRLVAANGLATSEGPDGQFATFSVTDGALPDGPRL